MDLKIENVDKTVCDLCPSRFRCYTTREVNCAIATDGISGQKKEMIRQMQIRKAKRQGHYHIRDCDNNDEEKSTRNIE